MNRNPLLEVGGHLACRLYHKMIVFELTFSGSVLELIMEDALSMDVWTQLGESPVKLQHTLERDVWPIYLLHEFFNKSSFVSVWKIDKEPLR